MPTKTVAKCSNLTAVPRAIAGSAMIAALVACATPTRPAPVAHLAAPTTADTAPRSFPGLHNVVAYHDGFLEGGVPEGAEGFDSLVAMGIKTVISVDGSEPDVALASSKGLRYIHLPVGYNGFDDARRLELTRATRDALAQGPVYLHCHHGKHRAAGAAGAVAVGLGWMTPDQAVARMRVSGTAENYTGLYAAAANACAVSPQQLEAVPMPLPQVVHPKGVRLTMVELDQAMEHLRLIQRAGWQAPKDHPDLVPVAEAGRAADLLRVAGQGDEAKAKPAEFADLFRENAARFQEVEDLLGAPARDAAALNKAFERAGAVCTQCHQAFRDPDPVFDLFPR